MMKRAAALSPSPLILPLFILLLPLPPAQSSDIIDKICKTTPFYDLCESSLRPLAPPNATSATDPKSLAAAMTSAVLGNMTETLVYIEGLVRHSRDPATERSLAKCAELYRPAVRYNIPQAIDAMRRGEFGFAAYVLNDAEKQADTCNKGLSGAGAGGTAAGLRQRNTLVKNLCDVAIAVIKLVTKGA